MHSQNKVLRNAAAAAIVGSLAGTAAAFLSVPIWPPIIASTQIPIVEGAVAPPRPPVVPETPLTLSKSTLSVPAARPRSPEASEAANPLPRAAEMARRPDVRGLLALREEIAQRTASGGGQGPDESRRQLDEIDRYLSEARALQLRRDAQDLRRSSLAPTDPR